MPRGPFNLHRGLGDDELPWRYVRRHDRVDIEDAEPVFELNEVDEYWDPEYELGALDVQLQRMWQEIVNLGFTTRRSHAEIDPRPRRAIAPDELAAALHEQLERVARAELDGPHDEVLEVSRRVPELRRWFEQRRGPGLTLLVLEPFWIRPLATWPAESLGDLDAIGRSLVEHLLVRYPVPAPLYRPWRSSDPPPLKWATWLVLIGQGASLHRAAPHFGWSVSTKLAQHLNAITDDISPIDAVMWAEIMRLGGSRTELARIRRHPGYVFDPTGPDEHDRSIDGVERPHELPHQFIRQLDPTYRPAPRPHAASEAFRAFWRSTAGWLAAHRDELTDATSDAILDWALHRHIEDAGFAWSGRTLEATLEHARAYRQTISRVRVVEALVWPGRGWNWEHPIDDSDPWRIVELTSAVELAEESRTMQHCVASYAYRCVQGASAIFSVSRGDGRRFTVEIDPRSRQLVQARGARNRSCDDAELALVRRWLVEMRARST